MARTVATIQQQIIDHLRQEPTTPTDISTKQVSKWLNWTHIVAVCISFFEQILDIFTSEVESRVNRAGVGSPPWIIDRVKEFQYGNAVIYDTTIGGWAYPAPASELIISRAAVVRGANKVVYVKVAKNDPPAQLASGEETALTTYINKIGVAGVEYSVINLASDKIYIDAEVTYDGQYSDSIQDLVETSINTLFETLSSADNFGSNILLTDIQAAIKNTAGVRDVKINEVAGRPDTTVFAGRNQFYVLASGINNFSYPPESGYVVAETTSGQTLSDSITYTPVLQ